MRVLVTGGAGFIGTNLTRELIDAGHEPRVLDDYSTGLASNISGLGIEVVQGSLTDLEVVKKKCEGHGCRCALRCARLSPKIAQKPASHS